MDFSQVVSDDAADATHDTGVFVNKSVNSFVVPVTLDCFFEGNYI